MITFIFYLYDFAGHVEKYFNEEDEVHNMKY